MNHKEKAIISIAFLLACLTGAGVDVLTWATYPYVTLPVTLATFCLAYAGLRKLSEVRR